MRRISTVVAVLLSMIATEGRASTPLSEVVPTPSVVSAPTTKPTPDLTELRLSQVQVREHSTRSEAAAAQLPARGSFWWLVGVIVVAGVILAVVL